MEATKFFSSKYHLDHLHQYPSHFTTHSPIMKPRKRKPSTLIIFATSSRSGGGSNSKKNNKGGEHRGRLVDENMIVLRMRIQETLRNEEEEATPPSNWMEWEKSYYAHNGYNEDVFEAIGFLQNCLMNIRPGLALGFIALVALSLVMSTGVVVFHAVKIAQIIIFYLFPLN
ncbi:hypothetical protein ACOSQ4_026544 [Xanthoceras sorbifolium]